MRQLLLVLILIGSISISPQVSAQKIRLSFGVTYGSFDMNEVKEFQEEVRETFPVNVKTMSEFPSYVGYEGKIYYKMNRLELGLFYSFNSSGSRLSYQDYSGTMEYNQLGKFSTIGVGLEYRLSPITDNTIQPYLSFQVGRGKTLFNINDLVTVGDATLVNDDLDFVSQHITIHPGIGLRIILLKRLVISPQVGYLIDGSDSLEYKEDKDLKLLNNAHDPIGPNWSGVRASISLGIRL